MKLGEKIKSLRKREGLTQADLAKKLGVAPTAVSAWERDDNRPLMDKLSILSKIFGVSVTYFFDKEDVIRETNENYEVSPIVELPIVGKVSCGNGIVALEEIEGYEATPKNWLNGGEYFYLRAKGDSMEGARIHDGDLLLIRKQEEIEDGEIAAVYFDGEAVLKRVYKQNGTLILQSENPKYKPIIITSGEVKIIGKLKKLVVAF
ncbi:LexA family protein [Sporolactobacillus kofuensis]|uniref:LexA family protein n=1 Tax=Sporolactobacillus kofuensis TaxID=269672 RepID=A0ABW1WD03_9BACL|nr:XRE family transcriptional regulator [Sporolactobacillus kofuensis]MCO7175527.1 XRE family transcriptional regulator [Sporolactobacillus kofuensis]